MPAAVQDSDDEDVLLDDEPSQRSTFSQLASHAASVLNDLPDVLPQVDGAADKPSRSTSSSDLRRQVADAERGLLATYFDQPSERTTGLPSSTSPAVQRNRRRNTTVAGSDPGISPAKSLKRVKTYAHQRTTLADDEHHSHASIGLPDGTIGNDFVNHEPNVMFRDTGTTNAFNDSTQEELLDQARGGGNNAQNVNDIPVPKTSVSDKSSSFPWTASAELTQTEKSPAAAQDVPAQEGGQIAVQKVPSLVRRPTIEPLSPVVKKAAFFAEPEEGHSEAQEKPTPPAADARSSAESSPVVVIDNRGKDTAPDAPHDEPVAGTEKPKRGRKRKSQEAVQEQSQSDDRLHSDDRVLEELGLAKEQYKPRPSRRRATQLEEPLDSSLPVEKAIRKRRKTENAASCNPTASLSHSQVDPRDGLYECPLGCKLRMKEEEVFSHLDQCPTKQKASQLQAEASKESDMNGDSGPQKKAEERFDSAVKPTLVEQSPKQPSRASSVDASPSSKTLGDPSSERKSDARLMLPPAIPASASKKGRRSKTTIFEDHVDFGGSQRSPNLSQQQAKRKAALEEVKNESTQKSRRKLVHDESDEEDELAMDEVDVEEPPQRKRKGRPAKAATHKPAKSTERTLKDPDAEDDEDELELEQPVRPKARGRQKMVLADSDAEDGDEFEVEKPPPKKGRGRPSKAKAKEKVLQDPASENDEIEAEEPVTKNARSRRAKEKSQEKVLEESDAEEEALDDGDEEDAELEEPPKKKRPGRQPKAKAGTDEQATEAAAHENREADIPPSDISALNKGNSSPTKAALTRKDSNQQPKATEMQSPKTAPPEMKSAPATHSPIKNITKGNSSGNLPIYRVGLSKTRKIPSLLKIVGKPRPDARR